jgi:hypothetical protein
MKRSILMITACLVGVTSCGERSPKLENERSTARCVYVTWTSLEVDKLASIWLIKRFIDEKAEFRFVEKGTLVENGIPFDTPDAEFRRYPNASCFESILRAYDVKDPALVKIGDITHDIEINYWGEKRFPESAVVADRVQTIIQDHPDDPEACLPEALAFFDEILRGIRGEPRSQ